MRAIERKLLRDLIELRGQAIAIALVMTCGVALFIMSVSTLDSLEGAMADYYDEYRFADVFLPLRRAPESLARRITEVSGVAQVDTRIIEDVIIDVPGFAEPVMGRMVSIPERGGPVLNRLHLRVGRLPEPGRPGEVLASEGFVRAHGLSPGDAVAAVLNSRRQRLTITGAALTPEHTYQIPPGGLLPDDRRFGVFWMMRPELEAAFDLKGAFNNAAVSLLPGASEPEVIRRLDRLAGPYGGLGAHGRSEQQSHEFLANEMRELRGMARVVPTLFLLVSALLLHVVFSRLVKTQQEQIATLKAFGYTNVEIGAHYVQMALWILVIGAVLGIFMGMWLGRSVTAMYSLFFHFPVFSYHLGPRIVVLAVLTAGIAAVSGALQSVTRAVRLPPAVAMRPEAPAAYGQSIVETLRLSRALSPGMRMILRNLERRPIPALLSCLGIASAVAVLILGTFTVDALDHVIEGQFHFAQRHDISLSFVDPAAPEALHDIANLPGVLSCEPLRAVPARLRSEHRSRRIAILGLRPDARLHRLVDMERREVPLPPDGLVISEKLGEILDVAPGEKVIVEVLEGKRPRPETTVVGLIDDFSGVSAYMDIRAVRRLLGEGDTVSGAFLAADPSRLDELHAALKTSPRVASVHIKKSALESFRRTIAENLLRIRSFTAAFAGIIAAAVVYNAARLSLSERGRELATLRVLGFTRREVSFLLFGELVLLTAVAIPLGLILGRGLAAFVITIAYDTELFRIPLVVSRFTNGFAAGITVLGRGGLGVPGEAPARPAEPGRCAQGKGVAEMKTRYRRLALWLSGVALAAVLGYSLLPEPVEVDLVEATRGPLLVTVDEDGRTRIRQRYDVVAPIAGRLSRIELRPGDSVIGAKTVVAVIETTDPSLLDPRARAETEARVKAAEAAVEAATAEAARTREVHELSRHAYSRASELIKSMAVSQDELDTAEHKQRIAEEEARRAEILVHIAAFELEQVQAALARAFPRAAETPAAWRFEVLSPIDGKVLRVFQESATVVAPAMRLIEVGDPDDLEVEIDVLSTDAVEVRPGNRVLFERWGGAGTLRGRVRLIEPSAFTKVSALGIEEQRVWVIAEIEEPADRRPGLGDGYQLDARIIIDERRDALTLPAGALFRQGGAWAVFVASGGRARLRRVEVGIQNGIEAEILAGLAMGESAVLHPSDRVRNGGRIRPARRE